MQVRLIPVLYNPRDANTDFAVLIKKPELRDALFLFNDNFEDRNKNMPGGNSARIRPYTFQNPPRAFGISTGWSSGDGGFQTLTDQVKEAIVLCFESINTILSEHPHIRRVFYSCDKLDRKSLGYALFRPSVPVIRFIADKLQGIPSRQAVGLSMSKLALSILEDRIERERQHKPNMLQTAQKSKYVNRFRARKRVREEESWY